MDCSGLLGPIDGLLPWVTVRDDEGIQVAFGPGYSGFITLTRADIRRVFDCIELKRGGVTLCGHKLTEEQVKEMRAILKNILEAS